MPNHVSQRLRVTGPEADLAQFAAQHPELDLNGFIPMPPAVKNTQAVTPVPLSQVEQETKNLKLFGARNGYDWAIKYWGTKWGTYEVALTATATELTYLFQSAWSPPLPAFAKMVELWPTLTFHLEVFDEGWFFAGEGYLGDKTPAFEMFEPKSGAPDDRTNRVYLAVYGELPEKYEDEDEEEEEA